MLFLDQEESRKRFGKCIVPLGWPVSVLPEITDRAGTWKPVFDFWLRWEGYKLDESTEDHTWDVLGPDI